MQNGGPGGRKGRVHPEVLISKGTRCSRAFRAHVRVRRCVRSCFEGVNNCRDGMPRRRQSVPRPDGVGAMLTLLRLPHEPAEACANSRRVPVRVAMLTAPICSLFLEPTALPGAETRQGFPSASPTTMLQPFEPGHGSRFARLRRPGFPHSRVAPRFGDIRRARSSHAPVGLRPSPLRGMPSERAYARTSDVNPRLPPCHGRGHTSTPNHRVRSLLVLLTLRPGLGVRDLL